MQLLGKTMSHKAILIFSHHPNFINRLLLLTLFALINFTACEKLDIAPDVPNCVKKKIRTHNKSSSCESAETVTEYKFQDKTVYVLGYRSCYGFTQIIDSNCKTIGNLGGLARNTKVNDIEFYPNATLIRRIWQK